MPTNFSTQTHQAICQQCQEERITYAKNSQSPSPACVELFRRAIAPDTRQTTWPCLDELFSPLLNYWASGRHSFAIEDVVQETWLRFLRSSTTTFRIQDENRLELILDYIRTTLLRIIAEWLRKERRTQFIPIDLAETIHDPTATIEQTQLRIDLERYISEFLAQANFTDDERLLFRLKYLLHFKPREIHAEFPELVESYDQLEVALQRISRRVKNYADFRNLQASRRKPDGRALLQLENDQDGATEAGKEINVDESCIYEESILLDYIMGMVEAEVAMAIEASPACLQQAGMLAEAFGPFLHFSYRLDCPSPEQLVAYQQRTLPGTERLVLYRHLATCPRCREDLMVLESMDASDATPQPTLLRRIVEAIYESPLAYGLQGSWLHYRTPELFINISSRQNRGEARSWTVHVQIRSHEGELLTPLVQAATLEDQENLTATNYRIEGLPTAAGQSSLIFRTVEAGNYALWIQLPEQEIIIRHIAVNDDGGTG